MTGREGIGAIAALVAGLGCGGTSVPVASAETEVTAHTQTTAEGISSCQAQEWETARVGSGPTADAVLAVDAEGRAQVAYTRSLGGQLVHAERGVHGRWSSTVLASDGSSPSIAAGPGGVWISFHDFENRSLIVAGRDGGEWSSRLVEGPTDGRDKVGIASSIATHAGALHVAYYVDGGSQLLHFATAAGDDWVVDVVDDALEEPERKPAPLLRLDPDGQPHIIYIGTREDAEPRLRPLLHAHRADGGRWITEPLAQDSSSEVGFEPSVAMDAEGALHVTHHAHGTLTRERGFVELRHATRPPGGAWRSVRWDWPAHIGGHVPIAVDSSSSLHVLCVRTDGEADRIAHAVGEGPHTWFRSNVAEGRVNTPRIAIAPDGGVHAIYRDGGDLTHAYRAPCTPPAISRPD